MESSSIMRLMRGSAATRRSILLGSLAVLVIVVWGVARWASAPTYVTLFRELEFDEAGRVGAALTKAGIPNRLGSGGNEVLVPAEDVPRARVAVAGEGLALNGRPGLELFDKPSWGMTDFTQRVTYQRALEGELARTIGGLRGVRRAQVHLVIPTPSPLRRLERVATASVVLSLDGGATLPPETIRGITYIVSNSVETLSSENVAVMDDAGRLLSVPAEGNSQTGMTSRQMEIRQDMETYLAGKIEGLLETVVGSGRARAQVSVDLSFDQIDLTLETFDPETQVLQSEQRSESEGGSGGEGAASQVVVNNSYQNSRRLERSIEAAGKIARLTAAVLVDESVIGTGPGKIRVEQVETIVRDAINLDAARGDRVTVLGVPFEPYQAPAESAPPQAEKPRVDLLRVGERVARPLISIAAIVALLLVGLRVARTPASGPGMKERLDSVEAGRPAAARPAQIGAGPALAESDPGAPPMQRADVTAQVLRSWLTEN